ncbi:MAG: hypothetical protein ACFFB3_08165 [Candidatus Hodarchaeota archaeon]
MSVDPNRLLFYISARRKVNWFDYIEAVDFLSHEVLRDFERSREKGNRGFLLHSLQAMGHCDIEFTEAGSVIYVSPPILCRLPKIGLPQGVLVGARAPNTISQINETISKLKLNTRVKVYRHSGELGLIPDSIIIESDSEKELMMLCNDLNIQYTNTPLAWALVNWCGTISEFESMLDFKVPNDLNWSRLDFNQDYFMFVRTLSEKSPRLTRYRNPKTNFPIHVYFKNNRGAEVDLYWGHYLYFHSIDLNVIAYDKRRLKLCVPLYAPLPVLITRALCLCLGSPPKYLQQDNLIPDLTCSDWILFEEVPPQIAMLALSKVGQSLIAQNIGN